MYYFIFSAVGLVLVLLVVFVLKPWERKDPICTSCGNLTHSMRIYNSEHYRCRFKLGAYSERSCPSYCCDYVPRDHYSAAPPPPPRSGSNAVPPALKEVIIRIERDADAPEKLLQSMMTYNEYREAVAGAELTYAMLFGTDEERERFLEALHAGGEAIKAINELREANIKAYKE